MLRMSLTGDSRRAVPFLLPLLQDSGWEDVSEWFTGQENRFIKCCPIFPFTTWNPRLDTSSTAIIFSSYIINSLNDRCGIVNTVELIWIPQFMKIFNIIFSPAAWQGPFEYFQKQLISMFYKCLAKFFRSSYGYYNVI